jgi:hypothetical protein
MNQYYPPPPRDKNTIKNIVGGVLITLLILGGYAFKAIIRNEINNESNTPKLTAEEKQVVDYRNAFIKEVQSCAQQLDGLKEPEESFIQYSRYLSVQANLMNDCADHIKAINPPEVLAPANTATMRAYRRYSVRLQDISDGLARAQSRSQVKKLFESLQKADRTYDKQRSEAIQMWDS